MNTHSEFDLRIAGRTALLAAAAVLALTASTMAATTPVAAFAGVKAPAGARPCAVGTCLWDQNSLSDNSIAIDSQNFTSGVYATYNDAAADDFLVVGTPMLVSAVDVSGQYFGNYTGVPSTSVNVTFYANTIVGGISQPGAVMATYTGIPYLDPTGTGSYEITLCNWDKKHRKCKPKSVKFRQGPKKQAAEYWVSVVANCSYNGGCGEWGWDIRTPVFAGTQPAVWENPTGAFSCQTTWNYLDACGLPRDDMMFDLR